MILAVVGIGLVSPVASTSAEHVFYLRAGEQASHASPFIDADGESIPVAYCPWLGARLGVGDRLSRLGTAALREATVGLYSTPALERVPLFVCTSPRRPGLSETDRTEAELGLTARLRPASISRFSGDAGTFAALRGAEALLIDGCASVVIVAVDSLISVEAITTAQRRPRAPWMPGVSRPAEGAAAFVVMAVDRALRSNLAVIARLHATAVVAGASTDVDDEIVDGVAMTRAIRQMPRLGPIGACFGQLTVDALRGDEWLLAVARNHELFHPEHESTCLEDEIGRLGSAAGAMSLVHGIAMLRHGAARSPCARGGPFVAWAISPDGTRGLTLGSVEAP